MILIDFVPLHLVLGEIAPHIPRHYEEMSDPDDYGTPRLNWDAYIDASKAGACYCLTARDDGKLIGYSWFSVGANPRYCDLLQADNHAFYIEKPYRGKLGQRMIREADSRLAMMGVLETNYTESDDLVGRLLGRSGYRTNYKIYTRRYLSGK